jgi:ribosome-associated protein
LKDKFCELVLESALEKKAVDTIVIDITQVSLMADFMLVCSGRSKTHVQGIANYVIERAKENGHRIFNIDGLNEGEWVLVDLGTIIVHIMIESVRKFYTLEKLWNNGKIVYLDEEYPLEAKKA